MFLCSIVARLHHLFKDAPRASALRRLSRTRRLAVLLAILVSCAGGGFAQTNVVTQHNDIARTGANTNETILTPANISVLSNGNYTNFGKLFSNPVDGWVYAQPLYMPGVTMGVGTPQAGTTHNLIFIATEHDSLYAFDADTNTGANGAPLWKVSLIDAAHGAGAGEKTMPNGDVSTGDVVPEIGITSTPVIDPATNTIYVVAKSTVADTTFIQRLHAIDITTGLEKFGGPVTLSGSVTGTGNGSSGGTLHWDPKWENNRTSLLLLNGIVYIGFGSHGDNGPWHGWILAYNAATLAQTGVWCATPNNAAGGIWMSGTGLAADVPSGKPFGRIFTSTGNGTFTATTPYTNAMDYGDSVIKLDLANGVPTMISGSTTVGDDFTPHDQSSLNNGDEDQASGGVVILPDSVGGGGGAHQLAQLGKSGRIYILNRENLGGYTPTNTKDPQEKAYVNGLWGAPAYWNGHLYFWGNGDRLKAFSFANGAISSTYTSISNEGVGGYSPTPSVSANGATNGIVWSLRNDAYGSQGREILYAHDATNVANLLYSSESNVGRDNPGNAVKFIVPTIINGKVYAGSESQVSVYGLLNGATQASTPVINPGTESFNPSVQVSISDSTSGASIYYTTNGSTPTASSTLYTAPFTITTTTTVNAIAAGTGLLSSAVASVTYSLVTQNVTPVFNPSPGAYTTVQSVTITSTSGATIYYTTDGTTPTASSTKYIGPVSVGATETLSAIAIGGGLSNSPIASGLYTVDLGGVSSINLSTGFTAGAMNLLGSSKLNGTALELTDGGANEAAAAWYQVEANIQAFTTDFTFQITPGTANTADGMTFAIQGNNSTSIGPSGGGLGYGPDTPTGTPGIANSLAIKFDLYSNASEGVDSTGLYLNGVSPTTPAIDMTSSGVNLHNGNPFHVHMTYDGTTLVMAITDTVTNATFTHSWTVDIPTTVGDTVAYLGFTGGTGGSTATQNILNWTYVATTSGTAAATPTFNPLAGTYLGTQSVSLSDSTSGATIYYTTDGSVPTTSSTKYTAPITVTATETINAIATATGFTASPVGTAKYTIESQVAAPTFSPAAGSYPSAQTVTISTTSPGATIYYTTNGAAPTTSSTQYSAPITVSASETIQAIAVASGFFNSNVSTASYTISSGVTVVNLGSGFTTGAMLLNGKSALNGTRLRVTDGGTNEASSAWYNSPVNIQQFTTNFTFQITGGTAPTGDGLAFVIQGGTTTALGPLGGGLGYGPDTPTGPPGIPKSVAVKFDLYSNAGEGIDSTGLYINGASPTTPAVDMTSSGVNLHTTDVFNVQLTYDGTNLTMTITDATTNATFTHSWPINIPTTVGANTAYVGFTGGTGGNTAIQEIIGWTLASSTTVAPAATPTLSPAPGTYTTAQTVTISDTTTGATIYYTTNGTAPTTASTVYGGTISVNATETIQAIATAAGFSQSAVASGTYTINLPAAATPTFSPAAGVYTSAQSVTIGDTTIGAKIYYTTNGTTPTTASTLYSGPISVNATETIQAIASAAGFSQSAVASATYTINLPSTINYAGGFSSTGIAMNGSTTLNGTRLRLTDGGANEAASAWYATPVNVQTFSSDFTFQLTTPNGDGFAFVIQNTGTTAVGPSGGGLGYGPDNVTNPTASANTPIAKSVAIKFDLYSNAGEGGNSTGLYINGVSPTIPALTLGGGVNLHSGDTFKVHLNYDGTTLTMTITDTVNTTQTFTTAWAINIPSTVGGNTAYVGFTGGTGGSTATQEIITWSYNNSFSSKHPVNYQTTKLTAVSSGPTFRQFTYTGFPDTTGTILDATKVGDNVTFTVNVATPGIYDVQLSDKKFNTRGISQLSINGTNLGATLDQYAATDSYAINDYGTFNFPTAGNYSFKFTVIGKNASSSSFSISFDDIVLTPQ